MSIEIMNRVWDHSQQQGTKLVLLLALADMANNDGYCWPSLETLQQRARLSHRQNVIKAITEMEETAEVWVERNRGRNHSNTYIVTVGMSADQLTSTLINDFDYNPTEAEDKANEFLKRSPQTTLLKRSPEAKNVVNEQHLNRENVVDELRFSEENVVVGLTKRSPQTTRSIIEPIINKFTEQSSQNNEGEKQNTVPVGKKKKDKSAENDNDPERDEWFNVVCWLVFSHQDRKLLNKEDFININNTINTIRNSKEQYTLDELKRWYKEIWSTEWPGKQKNTTKIQHPSYKDIKTGIGRIRPTVSPVGLVSSLNGSADSPRKRMKEL